MLDNDFLCYVFAAYPSLYWPLLMVVSFDVQVLESDFVILLLLLGSRGAYSTFESLC